MADKDLVTEETFQQFMSLWILPEIERRREVGSLPLPFDLERAQVLFFVDGRPNVVRLNDEVRSTAYVKIKKGTSKSVGEPVFPHEIERIESLRLLDDEDPDCGHLTVLRLLNRWTIAFDFIYNKGQAQQHLGAAKEFLEAARHALNKKHWRVFIDNSFSAAELAAKAFLLTMPGPNQPPKNHKWVHARYNIHSKLGNVEDEQVQTLNRLSRLRPTARYLRGILSFDREEAIRVICVVEEAIQFAEAKIARTGV
jgi:HEPN domain-containing protein